MMMAAYDNDPGFFIDETATAAYRTDLAVLSTDMLTLELGCGSGVFTRFLHTIGLRVIGVDRSEEQLTEAREHLPDNMLQQGDIETAAAIDAIRAHHGEFDLLVSRYVIHELSDPIETFALWKRLLRPNGRLVLIENAWKRADWGDSVWGRRTDELPLACTQTWATAVYCLKKAGFSQVEAQWMQQVNLLNTAQGSHDFRLYRIVAHSSV
jgi:ubiquinone/menaquinone biosynthesis C-methylase UbiE